MRTAAVPAVEWLRQRLRGVRVRLTALATLLVAVTLALAGFLMLYVLHESLLTSADAATKARGTQIADVISAESLSGLDASLLLPARDIVVIQLIDDQGAVVAASPGHRADPLSPPVDVGTERTVDGATLGSDPTEYRATIRAVRTPAGVITVVVGTAEGPLDSVVITVATLFAVAFPILLLVLAATTYYFSGRTLRTVEDIRAQVAGITSSDLTRRVSEPATHDEINALARTMNEMLTRLQSARVQQLQFVGDASHELRSPLMTIVGILDLADRTGERIDDETLRTLLLPEAHRLQTMIDDLLLLAKADERGVPLQISDVDVDDIVAAEALRLQRLRTVQVTADIQAMRVRGDRDKLTRVVRNLTDNAARHAHSRVDLAMSSEGSVGTIVISDDGPGIPAADRGRVFDRFVRLDVDRQRASGGSGLGLAITAEIVHAHSGTVEITEAPGGGARVCVSVPLDVDVDVDESD